MLARCKHKGYDYGSRGGSQGRVYPRHQLEILFGLVNQEPLPPRYEGPLHRLRLLSMSERDAGAGARITYQYLS